MERQLLSDLCGPTGKSALRRETPGERLFNEWNRFPSRRWDALPDFVRKIHEDAAEAILGLKPWA